MRGATPLEAAAWLLTAGLLAAATFWPDWSVERRGARTRHIAESVLRQVGEHQRVLFTTTGHYAFFGAVPADREAALPSLALGPAAALFQLEALEQPEGTVRLRLVTRPEAIRRGDVTPLLQEAEISGR